MELSYTQGGMMNSGDSFQYKAFDGTVYSNNATVNIYVSCSLVKKALWKVEIMVYPLHTLTHFAKVEFMSLKEKHTALDI